MLIQIPDVLTPEEIAKVRSIIEAADWIDGKATAGQQAALAKLNLPIPEGSPAAMEAGDVILRALGRNAVFNSAALPFRVLPPMFNRYDTGMKFDAHVDGAIRAIPRANIRMRADISCTLLRRRKITTAANWSSRTSTAVGKSSCRLVIWCFTRRPACTWSN